MVKKDSWFVMKFQKGQLQIQQMAFMLLAVALFFVLVGLFIFSIIYSDVYKQANVASQERTLTSITNLADSPEFLCVGSEPNCVDSDKLIALMNHKSYANFWPFSSLRIIKLSAFNKRESEMKECTLSNYPNCESFVVFDKEIKNEIKTSSFVALCRKENENEYIYDKCEIAKLIAGTEIQTPEDN
jgi:hypothetical protein